MSSNRSRNLWSAEEDNTLRRLVEACEKDKVDWRAIASYLPGRNNKDCRKRWHYRVSASMNLGPWSQPEDELLKMGIHRYGTHWSRVAQVVGTRNGDQCFKRWNDVLDPGIDRSPWTHEEDKLLLLAIGEYGRAWKQIVDTYFLGRTGLDAKNRHRQLTRKRKRELKASTTPATVKTEQKQISKSPAKLNQSPLPGLSFSPPSSSSPSPSTSSSPPSFTRIVRQNVIEPSLECSHLNTPHQQQQLELGERSLSAPPCSYSYWELPLDGLFSPPLPTTPYSSCGSTCTSTSNYDGSISQLDDLQTHPHPHPRPHPQLQPQPQPSQHQRQHQRPHSHSLATATALDQPYDGPFLMNAPQYPYFVIPPQLHNRSIDDLQQQHLGYLSPEQQDYALNLQRSTSNSAMHHPFAALDETVSF